MRIILTMALAALAGAAWAQESTLTPQQIRSIAASCPADKQCIIDRKTGEIIPSGGSSADSYQRIYAGPDILSLEETATRYFRDIARQAELHPAPDDPFNPQNILRDRDGLTTTEAAEVMAFALQAAVQQGSEAQQRSATESKASGPAFCKSLNNASTADAQLAVLEEAEVAIVQKNKQTGAALLNQLSPRIRPRIMQAIAEYRKGITVSRQDWKKLRTTQPEALESFRADKCTSVPSN